MDTREAIFTEHGCGNVKLHPQHDNGRIVIDVLEISLPGITVKSPEYSNFAAAKGRSGVKWPERPFFYGVHGRFCNKAPIPIDDMRDRYLRVAAAVPQVTVGDVRANLAEITAVWDELDAVGVEVAVFPEMCLTGYTCGDLFHSDLLLNRAWEGLVRLVDMSHNHHSAIIVGLPIRTPAGLHNCAAVIDHGLRAIIPKTYIPTYNEFYERRWWAPAPEGCTVQFEGKEYALTPAQVVQTHGTGIGVEICEDLWVPAPPSTRAALSGATVIFNLSASDDLIGKYDYLTSLVKGQSARLLAGYVYAGAGAAESSTDLVFDGKGLICENGSLLAVKKRWDPDDKYVIADIDVMALERDRMHFTTFADCAAREGALCEASPQMAADMEFPADLRRYVHPTPFVPADPAEITERCTEIVNIQSTGLQRRLRAIGCHDVVIGISGGLDSTLALLVAVHAFDALGLDRKGIHGITMPGFGTTGRTHDNAVSLMQLLGVSNREISIAAPVELHFSQIGHDPGVHDVTYENSQARQRTLLLMDTANQVGGIVVGTGDLSELALGWATYNGDHMSMYGVNAGVPKTLVSYLVTWFADTAPDQQTRAVLLDIIATPISPELIPANSDGTIAQRTEDLVGPYELHDFFLYYTLRFGFPPRRIYNLALKAFDSRPEFSPLILKHWLRTFYRRFFSQQFKRSCMPDGPKVGSVCLSPRGDWRMPSDASAAAWLREADSL